MTRIATFPPLLRHPRSLEVATLVALVAGSFGASAAQTSSGPASETSPSTQILTLKSTARLVDIDVVVTDRQGNPVTGLTQADFSVEEEKTPQTIRSFDVHTVARAAAPHPPPLPPNTFLNLPDSPAAGAPTVILYDALHTPFDQQNFAREQLLNFVRNRKPGAPVALFVLVDKLRLVQGFTDDIDLLVAALNSKSAKGRAGPLHNARAGSTYKTPGGFESDGDLTFQKILANASKMDVMAQVGTAIQRGDVTRAAFIQLGRFLASFPGRKNLVWLSSSFDSGIFRSQDPSFSAQYTRAALADYRLAAELFDLSHTAIYPVDVNGVRAVIGNPRFGMGQNASHVQMDLIADASGGKAFYGTNRLDEAVGDAIANGSTFYSLSYEPTNPNYDGSLRHIKVALKRSGYSLSYRRTYHADDLGATSHPAGDLPGIALASLLESGVPTVHDLLVVAHLDPAGPPAPATAEQRKVLSDYRTMQADSSKTRPEAVEMMQQYVISIALVGRQLEMPVSDAAGTHKASLEFGVVAYDQDGRKVTGLDTRIDDPLSAERYTKLAAEGYRVAQTVAVPVTATSLRLAVRDVKSNRVGSLEVRLPLAKIAEAQAREGKVPAN